MPKATRKKTPAQKKITQYEHADKDRANNPPVGFVTPETDNEYFFALGTLILGCGKRAPLGNP